MLGAGGGATFGRMSVDIDQIVPIAKVKKLEFFAYLGRRFRRASDEGRLGGYGAWDEYGVEFLIPGDAQVVVARKARKFWAVVDEAGLIRCRHDGPQEAMDAARASRLPVRYVMETRGIYIGSEEEHFGLWQSSLAAKRYRRKQRRQARREAARYEEMVRPTVQFAGLTPKDDPSLPQPDLDRRRAWSEADLEEL